VRIDIVPDNNIDNTPKKTKGKIKLKTSIPSDGNGRNDMDDSKRTESTQLLVTSSSPRAASKPKKKLKKKTPKKIRWI